MKGPLRVKFFKWLAVQTLTVFTGVAVVVAGFNLHEVYEHPGTAQLERNELLIILAALAAAVPLALLLAWVISKQLLKPIHVILETAETIRAGDLAQRVHTELPDDELGRLGRTVNEAFDRYQESLERLERFSYDASHQLRNPLAAIRAAAEICLSRTRTPGEYEDTLGRVLEDVQRLNRTVDQLLTLARLSPRQIVAAFKPLDLSEVIRTLVAEFRPVCEARDIVLESVQPPGVTLTMLGVRDLLYEALGNLLDNALQHTPEKGVVRVDASRDRETLCIRVGDSGPGMSDEGRQSLGKFQRGKGSGRRGGHGLGLVIVSDIVAAHGGTFTIGRSPLGGAEFALTLTAV